MNSLLRDLRFSLRSYARDPLLYTTAVLTLALGIGANTAIYSVVDTVLLRPLPYQNSDRIMEVWTVFSGFDLPHFWLSEREFGTVRERVDAFDSLAAYEDERYVLTGRGEPRQIEAERVSSAYFDVLGQEAVHGRTFRPEEDQPGRNRVVVSSYGLWRELFGADPDAVGQTLILDGDPYVLVGVLPARFRSPARLQEGTEADLWVPLDLDPAALDSQNHYLKALGVLGSGAGVERAGAQLASAVEALKEELPANYEERFGFDARLGPLSEQLVGDVRPVLMILLAAVALVLLIACANIANLLLARAEKRRNEMAVRSALGAGRKQIFRQLLVENVVLSLIGGALGFGLAYLGMDFLRNAAEELLPAAAAVRLDMPVILFTAGISILSGFLFGLAPATHALSTNLQVLLKSERRESSSPARRLARGTLVVTELALAVVLTVAAGLLLYSLQHLLATDPGFQPKGLVAVDLWVPDVRYSEEHEITGFYREAVDRLESLPGVESAGAIATLPLSDSPNKQSFELEGVPLEDEDAQPLADLQLVRAGYFETLRIPLRGGRPITDSDDADSAPVMVVDQEFVDRYLPGRNPLGQGVMLGGTEGDAVYRIVGVVGRVRQDSLTSEYRGTVYVPHEQISRTSGLLPRSSMTVVLRSEVAPDTLVPAIKREVWSMDDLLPVEPLLVEEVVAQATARNRFTAFLLALFAGVGLSLAAVGIFGVLSYSAARRNREIGIRMALGARRGQILRLVARQGLVLTLFGLGLGTAAALAATEVLGGLLYGVGERDPVTFVVVLLFLGVVAMTATLIPAVRVTRIDPSATLKVE